MSAARPGAGTGRGAAGLFLGPWAGAEAGRATGAAAAAAGTGVKAEEEEEAEEDDELDEASNKETLSPVVGTGGEVGAGESARAAAAGGSPARMPDVKFMACIVACL
jgi:hypothetical protein